MEQYLQKWRLSPAEKPQTEKPSSSSGFECNICLDMVKDPVVTFCGHLYCWPCIYRWISFHENNDDQTVEYYLGRHDHHKKPQCPVCKSHVSEKTLIPLYGQNPGDELSHNRLVPQRPSSPRCGASNNSVVHRNNFVQPYYSGSYLGGGIRSTHLVDPMIGETTLYAYPNSYELAGSTSPRLRRYMKKADESLGRVCCFLWCCAILCLLLF